MDLFDVLAEPKRRAILGTLRAGDRSVGELSDELALSQPTVSKHLRVLRTAGFVSSTPKAQHRIYRLDLERLLELDAWLAPYRRLWADRLDALEEHLDRMEGGTMSSHGQFGYVSQHGDHTTLRFQRSLRHSPEKVWRALTESAHLRWWMPVDMVGDRKAGSTVDMVFWPDLVEQKGLDPNAGTATIKVCEPMRTFEWVWHDTTVRFDIDPATEGCDLTLTVEVQSIDPDIIVDNAGGFHLWMDHLTTLLDNGSTPPIAAANADHLEPHYRNAVGQA